MSDLPGGWAMVKVGDLARADEQPVLTGPFGTNMGRNDFTHEGCPVLTIGCLTDSGIRIDKAAYVRPDKANDLERYRLRAGDLLFSRMASVGRAGMVTAALDGALFNYHIMRLRLSEQLMLPELFLAYVRGAPAVSKYLDDVNHGATGDGINTAQLVDMPVLLPPLAEQRRIVAKLEVIQTSSRRAREALDAVPPRLEKLRQSILAAAFRGDLTKDWRAKRKDLEPATELLKRIRTARRQKWESTELAKLKSKGKPPIDDKWKSKYREPDFLDTAGMAELPDGWTWASPREVVAWASGEFLPRLAQKDGPYPVYGGNGISGWHSEPLVETLTLVVGRVGADCGNVHITTGPAWITDNAIYAGLVPALLNLDYWCLALSRSNLRNQARGGGQPFVSQETLNSLVIPVPPEAEQVEIVKAVRSAEERVRTLGRAVAGNADQLAILERAVLAKAFRGELVPQDPDDEPAEAMLARTRSANGAADTLQKRGRPRSPQRADQPND